MRIACLPAGRLASKRSAVSASAKSTARRASLLSPTINLNTWGNMNEGLSKQEPEATAHPENPDRIEFQDEQPKAARPSNSEDFDQNDLERVRSEIGGVEVGDTDKNEKDKKPHSTPITEVISGKDGLGYEDLERLAQEIHRTPYISFIPEKMWRKMEEIYVSRVDGELAGLLALVDLGDNWVEIGPLIIMQEYPINIRAQIARQLISKINEGLKGRNAFWTSHNPTIQQFAEKMGGFQKVSLFKTLTIPPILKRHLSIVGANISPANRHAMREMREKMGPKPKDTEKAGDVFAIKYAEKDK